MTKTASTSSSELKKFTGARRAAAFMFLVWAVGCASMLWVQFSLFACPGTPISFLFSDEFLLRANSYLVASAALAIAAATFLVLTKTPSRTMRWSLFAIAVAVLAVAFTFRGVHSASGFGVVPTLWSLRFALMKAPAQSEGVTEPLR